MKKGLAGVHTDEEEIIREVVCLLAGGTHTFHSLPRSEKRGVSEC